MKCVLLLASVVVLLCGVYSIQKRSPLSETKNLKYISRPTVRASALLRSDLDTAASYDNWHHTVTKHIHSHKHEVIRSSLV